MADVEKAELAVKQLLSCFGVDTDKRPGMEETPKRVVKMLGEVWEGMQYTNDQLAEMYGKTFDCQSSDMVVIKDIEAFSYCEHHLALIYDMKISVGYYPSKGKVIGLSKIARIVDMCCKRLQLQERIGTDILEVMQKIVGEDVIIRIEANHSCMTARGIKKPGAKTVTISKDGLFNNFLYSQEFLELVKD
nr:MAG TPA: GTP cyclohydrolase I [Caudoviricetes sp.]